MSVDSDGSTTTITQTLTGLDTSAYYVFNASYSIVSFSDDTSYCVLSTAIGDEGISFTFFESTTTGYVPLFSQVQPDASSADLSITFICHSDDGSSPGTLGEIYVDLVRFEIPYLTCAMYIQVVHTGTTVDGDFIMDKDRDPTEDGNMGFVADISYATQYTLDPYGNVLAIAPGLAFGIWEQDSSASPNKYGEEPIFVYDLSDTYVDGSSTVDCSIESVSMILMCANFGDTVLAESGVLALGTASGDADYGYELVMLQISYVSYNASPVDDP